GGRAARAAGRVPPPIVVLFCGGVGAGARHYIAMEYVEGTDLAQLVKDTGPLPVAQACDYIRQAALDLQHAHECGLVHRDIKPSNLILSALGPRPSAIGQDLKPNAEDRRPIAVIKILDLGLARFRGTSPEAATAILNEGQSFGRVTPAGAMMMGTPDYLAPEQALNFHKADGRADIYSLGCTLYFLLTGEPPFAGGTLAE